MQTRQDLERLRGFVEGRWGRGHCLLICMNDIHRAEGTYGGHGSWARNNAMIKALGFRGEIRMYDWNDQDGRTTQDVLDRIDNALKGL